MNESGFWHRAVTVVVSLPRRVLLGSLWFYQHAISPWRQPSCKFYPSCSQYAVLAVTRHGAVRGSWLAARRLGRCHPWAVGGVDDVPDAPTPSSVPTTPHEIRSSAR